MTRKKLLEMIEEGEGPYIEFKQRFSSHQKIAKEIIAFANTKGGYLLFGINDDRSICGVQSEKEVAALIEETLRDYIIPLPTIETTYFDIEGKEIVLVYVQESNNKPLRINDYNADIDINTAQVYVRSSDKSVLAGKEMIKILQTTTGGTSLINYNVGKIEKAVFTCLENKEFITASELSEKANVSLRRASRSLINLVRAGILQIHVKDNGENFFTQNQ